MARRLPAGAERVAALPLCVTLAACAPRFSAPPEPSGAEWRAARARLDALRRAEPEQPWGVVVRVSLREPRSGRTFAARGALAVEPHRAMRMILLGPGGGTALDAWVTPDAYRLEVPPLGRLDRGGARADAALPVAFFRWWFLAPLEGRLLASYAGPSLDLPHFAPCEGRWFILRRDAATVTLCDVRSEGPRSFVHATQRTGDALETLAFRGEGLAPHAGDRAEYADVKSGVRASVEIESRDPEPPDPAAFLDPDHGGAR